jgi:hypothetical protein
MEENMAMTDKPYEKYVDQVIEDLRLKNAMGRWLIPAMTTSQFRALLTGAWLAGLAYSLDMIEGEKERRGPLDVRLRDMPKTFEGGGKMKESIIWEKGK